MAGDTSEKTVLEEGTVFHHAHDSVLCSLGDLIRNLQTYELAFRFLMLAEEAGIQTLLDKPSRESKMLIEP